MPRDHRRLIHGSRYTGGSGVRAQSQPEAPPTHHNRLARLTTSPEELGIIGAELAKRLTMAAEEFLSELAAEQVKGSFRAQLDSLMPGDQQT
ncbi:MAG: hypothetical protein ACM3XZ_04495 [Betaproteobacteria bacterium]